MEKARQETTGKKGR